MRKLNRKEIEQKLRGILEKLKTEVTAFDDISDEAIKERKEKGEKDRFYFAKTYFPHYCYSESGEIHEDLNNLFDIPGEMTFFAGPRESGKTTWAGLIVQLHDIYFNKKHFEIIISETALQASDYAQFIKIEIESNTRLKQDFGDLKGNQQWNNDDFVTANDVRVLSRGRGQALKGLRWRQYRVDRIVAIDLENMRSSRNPRIVKEIISWISGEVRGGLTDDGNFLMEGQIIRKKCAMAHFINEKDIDGEKKYISRVWAALYDNDTRSYWPEGKSVASLRKKKRDMGTVEWNRWMQNNPVDDEGAFREEWIRYYHPDELIGRTLLTVTAVDPSVKNNESSDFKAVISVGKDIETGIFYVRDAWIRKSSTNSLMEVTFRRYIELNPFVVGWEDVGFQSILADVWEEYVILKGITPPIKLIPQSINKEMRIIGMSPLVERGMIRFQKGHSDQELLIEQLVYFLSPGVKDDGPDALEMAIRLLKIGMFDFEYKSLGAREMTRKGPRGYLNG